jgi:hypothetical protein
MLRRFGSHQWFQPFAGGTEAYAFGKRVALTRFVSQFDMFKISIVDTPSQRKLVVEGKLSEPWVNELRTTWRDASRDLDARKLVVDLSSLTVISREGEEAIFDLMKQGAKFSCAGILTRHVLKGLARRCRCEP